MGVPGQHQVDIAVGEGVGAPGIGVVLQLYLEVAVTGTTVGTGDVAPLVADVVAIVLGADEYFVLGDNRNNSEDSRSANIGNISRGMIEGKAWYHLKSHNRPAGRVE